MKYIRSLRKKGLLLLVILFAVAAGGVTTAVVSAAIPDADGTIHACYRNGADSTDPKGGLRIIDSDANEVCTDQESAISWSTSKQHVAYAAFTSDGSLNTAYSSPTVTNAVIIDSSGEGDYVACFDLSFAPKSMYGIGSATGQTFFVASFDPGGQITSKCGPGYNALAYSVTEDNSQAAYTFMD